MRQEVVVLVEELEARPRAAPRVLRSDRQRRDQVAERREHACHQGHGGVRQRPKLRIGLLRVREVPLQDLQDDLVADVEEIRAEGRHAIPDEGNRIVVLAATHGREHHRPGRGERGIRRNHSTVVVEDLDELAEVGLLPVPTRPLALLEDGVERSLGRRDVVTATSSGQWKSLLGPAHVAARRTGCARRICQRDARDRARSSDRGARWSQSPAGWGTMWPSAIKGTASCTGASMPFAPSSAMPSGRSRNMKCRNAFSPKGTSVKVTPAG
jgi:hypothetical protein